MGVFSFASCSPSDWESGPDYRFTSSRSELHTVDLQTMHLSSTRPHELSHRDFHSAIDGTKERKPRR